VARNLAIDRLRARKSSGSGLDSAIDVADARPGPEASAIASSDARRITDCLGTLEPDRAGAVKGAYLNGDSYQDLAERYGVPLNTMRTWLRRSLVSLRECMSV
jgi:RNA polymerase sigma-70 factor (ECF subfamily)